MTHKIALNRTPFLDHRPRKSKLDRPIEPDRIDRNCVQIAAKLGAGAAGKSDDACSRNFRSNLFDDSRMRPNAPHFEFASGLHLDWEVLRQAGQSRVVDMFLNSPVMDMNRNAIWRNPESAPLDGIERITRFWGDETWKQAAYAESPQYEFFSVPGRVKQDNDAIVAVFRERLRRVAGFVPEPLPMKNSNNAVVYYLFFASPKPVAEKIIESIFSNYR